MRNSTVFDLDALQENLDEEFLLQMGMVIYFMQCGFAFLEAGAIRAKNTTNILMKNIIDSGVGSIVYWAFGYALAFGKTSNLYFGYDNFFLVGVQPNEYAFYFFQFVFAATAATIVSGAMAERTKFSAYFIYSIIITGLVYPVVAHWAWSGEGWLSENCPWEGIKFQDFAGSGVVHSVGGAAGLIGSIALGPRSDQHMLGKRLRGHTVPLMCLGGFILFFGFLAFNAGSQKSITSTGDGSVASLSVVNTILSGYSGGITSTACAYKSTRKFSILACINGIITGMVSISAGCNIVSNCGAIVTGIVAGLVFFATNEGIFEAGVDDPLGAVAVHLGGCWGIIAVTLFSNEGVINAYDEKSVKQLAWNLIGLISIVGWTVGTTGSLFFAMKAMRILRISEASEDIGLDVTEHGESAYPPEAFINTDLHIHIMAAISRAQTKTAAVDLMEGHLTSGRVVELSRTQLPTVTEEPPQPPSSTQDNNASQN